MAWSSLTFLAASGGVSSVVLAGSLSYFLWDGPGPGPREVSMASDTRLTS